MRTTLDRSVQTAADSAVATVPKPAALVAIRPSTGAILAVADNAQVPFEIGLGGRFPAGSTFKIVTSTALLQAKVVRPASTVDCPGTTVVYGKEFENEDKFDLGRIALREAFANSCNTTFTGLSQRLDPAALRQAAALYGVGTQWKLAASSFGGSVPVPKDDTEKAAEAIGQGRVEVSPLTMALIAAQVAKGGPVVPSLIAGGAGRRAGAGRSAGRGAAGAAGHDAGGGHRGHRHAAGRRAGRSGVRQDRHRRVRHSGAAALARLVHRVPGRPGVRGVRPGRAVVRHRRGPGRPCVPDRTARAWPRPRSAEHDRPGAVAHDPVLDVPAHGPGQYLGLHVPAGGDQRVRPGGVVDPLHVLPMIGPSSSSAVT